MRFDPANRRRAIGNRAPSGPFQLNRTALGADKLYAAWTGLGGLKDARDLTGRGGHLAANGIINVVANAFGGLSLEIPPSAGTDFLSGPTLPALASYSWMLRASFGALPASASSSQLKLAVASDTGASGSAATSSGRLASSSAARTRR